MTTPLILLVLMTAPYLIVRAYASATKRPIDGRHAASVGAGLLFVFTGVGHFVETESMLQMLPPWVPYRGLLVYATGLLEFAIAVGFFVPTTRRATGWIAIGLLVLFFPVNVYAALNRIEMGGHSWGPAYLLIRAPLQVIILLWIYWFAVRAPRIGRTSHDAA
ncbi:MAG: hypothetical protein JWP89_6862 [Schlesneria sp.]|nr:hypothetical protein [Schlesneria sp.]